MPIRKKRGGSSSKNTIIRYRKSKPVVKYRTRVKTVNRYRKPKQTILGGINVGGALKDMLPLMCGALLAKFTAKKFAEGGAEGDNWTWKNYGWGLLGTTVAAVGTAALFRRSRIAQKVFEGGLLLLAYKIFTNELAPKSQYLDSWFGADEDIYPDMNGFGGPEAEKWDLNEGDIYQGDETDYVYGADQAWRPVDEMHREVSGALIEQRDPSFGALIEKADPSFGVDIERADPTFGSLETLYQKMYS